MNVLIAVVIMSALMGYYGSATTTIDAVTPDSPAMTAGLQAGDRLVRIGDSEIASWGDVTPALGDGEETTVVVVRGGEETLFKVTPEKSEDRYIIGITPVISHNPVTAVKNGCIVCWGMTTSLFDALHQIFTGKAKADELAGPVGMVTLVHETSGQGAYFFLYLLSFVSLNLAIFNLLPFPALDGGRIVFVILRLITGRAITDRMEAVVHTTGMILLLMLLVFVTRNDILRLFQ